MLPGSELLRKDPRRRGCVDTTRFPKGQLGSRVIDQGDVGSGYLSLPPRSSSLEVSKGITLEWVGPESRTDRGASIA